MVVYEKGGRTSARTGSCHLPRAVETWSVFGRVHAVPYVIKYEDVMMANSFYYTASPVHVFLLFKLTRGHSSIFPSSCPLHPSESWFRPLYLVFPELVRICLELVSRSIFYLSLAAD